MILHAKNGDRLFANEKSLGILDFDLVLFPWAMNTVVFEHVNLEKLNSKEL